MNTSCSRVDSSCGATPSAAGWTASRWSSAARRAPQAAPGLRRWKRHSPVAAVSKAVPQSSPQPREAIPIEVRMRRESSAREASVLSRAASRRQLIVHALFIDILYVLHSTVTDSKRHS